MTAKRVSTQHSKRAADGAVHICFERILPDELDTDRSARHLLRQVIAARSAGPLDAAATHAVARMAVVSSKKWNAGAKIRCRFLDGSPKMQGKVEAISHEWEKVADMKFQYVKSGDAEVRISFYADSGSWSAVGRDALNASYFPLHQPTMNYGWLRDDTADTEYHRVVLHEFGHALGCIHEHQAPKFSRVWDKAAVLKYFSGPPNYWSPADIQSNVLQKYSPKGIKSTVYDPKSIMLYAFDAKLFADGLGPTNTNTKLSPKDEAMIHQLYP